MGNAKRAVYTAAVLSWPMHVLIVMVLAEVGGSEAEVESLSAALVTLPGDVLMAMLRAVVLTSTNLLDLACLANEVLLFGSLSRLQVALAVNLPTVVRLTAAMTLVESTLLHHQLCTWFVVPLAAGIIDGCHIDQILLSGNLCCKLLNSGLEFVDLLDFSLDGWAVVKSLDRRLASRACHEVKRDAKSAPLVSQEIFNARSVEDVAAAELDRRLRADLASIADITQIILSRERRHSIFKCSAFRLKTRQTPCFSIDTTATVAAVLVHFLAWSDL